MYFQPPSGWRAQIVWYLLALWKATLLSELRSGYRALPTLQPRSSLKVDRVSAGVQASVSSGVHPAKSATMASAPQAIGEVICAASGATYRAKAMLYPSATESAAKAVSAASSSAALRRAGAQRGVPFSSGSISGKPGGGDPGG